MLETSCIARPLTEEEVRTVVGRCFPERELRSFTPLSGGLFNNTVRLDFAEGAPLILRAGPVNRDPLLPFEEHLMDSEILVDRLCEKAGIPCSHVAAADTSKTLLDRDFMVVDFIDAVPLSDPSVPEGEKPALYRETGRLTAMLHRIQGAAFGRVWAVEARRGSGSWSQALLRELAGLSAKCLEAGLIGESLLSKVRRLFAENAGLLDQVSAPCLVHADLWEGNVLVCQKGGHWTVAAIIDGDRAYFGDPDYDMATPWMVTPDFLAGYGPLPPDTPERRKRKALYRLLIDLTDAYVWQAEYQSPENYQKKKAEVEAACAGTASLGVLPPCGAGGLTSPRKS